MKNNFCKIYVSSMTSEGFIRDVLKMAYEQNGLAETIVSYIDENDEFSYLSETQFPDGFLYFKYIVDLDFKDSSSQLHCKEYIDFVIKKLWANNISAVASCDYENLLINKGGYKSKEIPWPKL